MKINLFLLIIMACMGLSCSEKNNDKVKADDSYSPEETFFSKRLQ